MTPKQQLVIEELATGAVLHPPNYTFYATGFLTSASDTWKNRSRAAQRIADTTRDAIRQRLCALCRPGARLSDVVFVHPATVSARLAAGWVKAHHTDRDVKRYEEARRES